jgi:hypothetical protein
MNGKIESNETPAHNERFGANGAVARLKVCANLEVYRPSERQWKLRLRQATDRCVQADESAVDRVTKTVKT